MGKGIITANALRRVAVGGMMRKHDLRDRACSQWYMKVAPMNDIALSCLVDTLHRVRRSDRWKKKGIRACAEALRLNPEMAEKAEEVAGAERKFRERMRKRLERDAGLAGG